MCDGARILALKNLSGAGADMSGSTSVGRFLGALSVASRVGGTGLSLVDGRDNRDCSYSASADSTAFGVGEKLIRKAIWRLAQCFIHTISSYELKQRCGEFFTVNILCLDNTGHSVQHSIVTKCVLERNHPEMLCVDKNNWFGERL